jgi:hypothetical protein
MIETLICGPPFVKAMLLAIVGCTPMAAGYDDLTSGLSRNTSPHLDSTADFWKMPML